MGKHFGLTAIVAGLLSLAAPTLATAQDHKLTYQSYASPAWATVQTDLWFMEEVKKRSNGAIDFETYYGNSLLGPTEIIPGTGQGVIHIGNVGPQYNPDLLPLSDVVQPFITPRLDAATYAVNRLYSENDAFRNEYESNNLKMLYTMAVTETVLATQKKVSSTEDIAGMRVRSQSSLAEVVNAFGGTAVSMPWSEGVDVFQRGGIDGLSSFAFDIAVSAGVQDIATHFHDFGQAGTWATVVTVMNLDAYNALPEDLRAVIDEVAAEGPAKYLEIIDAVMETAVKKVADTETVEITLTPEEEIPLYKEKAKAAHDLWIQKLEGQGLPAQELMDQYLKLVAEAETESTYVPALQRALEMRK